MITTKLNIDNLAECLKKIGGIVKEYRYKKFVSEYCLTTALLVTAITNLQFKSSMSLHAVVMYSVLGPYLVRDKLQDVFKEQIRTSTLEAKEQINKEKHDDYEKILLDKVKKYKEEKYKQGDSL